MLILKNCRFVPFLTEGTDLTQGDVLLDGQVIAKLNCVAAEDVPRPGFIEGLLRILRNWR